MLQEIEPKRTNRISKVVAWVAGIWIGCTLILEILLSTSMVTGIVNSYAARYIDGNISFGKVSASIFRNFPAVTLTLEDFNITYPSDRFDEEEASGPQGALLYRGNGENADTLASFSRFSASLKVTPLLFGKINIPQVRLEGPKIYAHLYDEQKANWNIFLTGTKDKEETDTSEFKLPKISIGRIELTDSPQIVYTDSRDTVFAMIDLKRAGFNGRLTTGKASRNRIGLSLDSMFVAGRISADTLALGLDMLHIHEHHDHMDIEAQAKTLIATREFGRINVPIGFSSTLHFPEDSVFAVGIHNFDAEIAAIPFEGEADLRFHKGRTEIDGTLSVAECKVDDLIGKFIGNFVPEAKKISTDAVIGIDATCKGDFIPSTGKLPTFRVDMFVPESKVRHKDIGEVIHLALDASLANTRRGAFNITVNDVAVRTTGLRFNAFGGVMDMLSEDPEISLDGSISASLDSLMRFLPDSTGLIAKGGLEAEISGSARLSHLSLYTFSQSDLEGKAVSDSIIIKSPGDSLDVVIRDVDLKLGPETAVSRRDSTQSFKLMGISGSIGRIDAAYKENLAVKGDGLSLTAKNSAAGADTTQVNRLGGRISAENLTITDASGTSIDLDQTQNGFQMIPKRDNAKIPVLSLTSSNKRITLATDVNRAILTDASIEASATMNTVERRQRARVIRDSLARLHPDMPEDSLVHLMRRQRQTRELPEWLQEEDFRKQDIDIRLDQSLAKYFRDWDMHGDLIVRTGIIMTPYFPLRNILRGMQICFTNDRLAIDTLKVVSGKSTIEAKGELTGLRRALAGSGRNRSGRAALNLDIDIKTDRMDANEILTAYKAGSDFNPETAKAQMAEATNAEFLQMVINDTVAASKETGLLVIPANLNADISLNGKDITWSDLEISDLTANLLMRERCVQITNTMATSNIGNVSFEGFYATRTKQDIKAGFNFDFKDITAEKAIDLMPAVDTVIPLLKSFAGKLNCELAATASLDTNMNILTPTINGVMRIHGDDLSISDSDLFTSLAKKLKFDNSKAGKISHMTVEGVIKDNVLEVFPFVLNLDRYTLALSGKQNLDMSYRYHASLIRSPMLIKVGVDIYGADFDNMKFKIGKPKYKNEKVPVFTAVIDETRINLAESIRGIFEKGVEAAIKENERQEAILEHRKEIGYINAVDQETEELSEEEQKALEETENSETTDNQTDNEQPGVH